MSPVPSPPVVEGEADFHYPAAGKPLKTWYKVTGELTPTSTPLFILHGGPGVGAEAYNIFSDLTVKYGIPIIQYDQVGCKRSTHLREKADAGEEFWNEDLFITELHNLVRHFGLDADGRQYDVIGHSWGGMFGTPFAAQRPRGLRKYVVWSAAPSIQIWGDAQRELRKRLPQDIQDVMERCEREGRTDSKEYKDAEWEFYKRFMCRLDPFPADIMDGLAELERDPTVYTSMKLTNWTAVEKISTIDVPVLLLNGKYDQAQDSCLLPFFERLDKVKWVRFEDSAHMAHFEERERFMQVLGEFLTTGSSLST
ncbi:proline-specific peptidase [Cytidiella melzeri]|nr:proline-specific peptidase [Cytidiella melzeri]